MKPVLLLLVCSLGLAATELHWRRAPDRGHPGAGDAPAADPATHPDPDGFERRAAAIVAGLGTEDLSKWRRGYFAGGDPGKYLPTAAMARLVLDPTDAQARALINDDRSFKEHYHFAALNWARFVPLYPEVLDAGTRSRLVEQVGRYTAYLDGGGTENHKVMWRAAACVLPAALDAPRFAGLDRAAAERAAREWIERYVRGLYHAGMGEWESATYHMFCLHSLLNVYDFAQDPELRLWAAAGLDYLAAAYALKYTDGILSGPSQRGYAAAPAATISDQSGWLWWGASDPTIAQRAGGFRYAMHPATSSWRPNASLCRIARKQVPLPQTARNSKPNYWFGLDQEPRPGERHESLHLTRHHSLGSLWSGWDPHGQTVRWQFTAAGAPGALTLTGGHPWDGRTTEGLGRYEQTVQVDGALLLLARIPERDELETRAATAFERALREGEVVRRLEPDPEQGGHPKLVLTTHSVTPEERADWIARHVAEETERAPAWIFCRTAGGEPRAQGGWWLWCLRDSFLALRPLGAPARLDVLPPDGKERKRAEREGREPAGDPALVIDGHRVGFLLVTGDLERHADLTAFATTLPEVEEEDVAADQAVAWTASDGRRVAVRWNPDGARARVTIDGEAPAFGDWPVLGCPAVTLADDRLRVWDGEQGYEVALDGPLPRYAAWAPQP